MSDETEITTAPVPEPVPTVPEPELPFEPDSELPPEPQPPEDSVLLERLEALRTAFPRMDADAVIRTEAFRRFGAESAWDAEQFASDAPAFLSEAVALAAALEPPVSRVTSSAHRSRRPLLTPSQQRSLSEWNRNYPDYAMSELDYFKAIRNS